MQLSEKEHARLPAHLQALFVKLPNRGSEEVLAGFPETTSGELLPHHKKGGPSQIGTFNIRDRTGEPGSFGGDSGSAARFFYVAKASREDREDGLAHLPSMLAMRYGEKGQGPLPQQTPSLPVHQRNTHPTVKPTDLMRYLCKLITPPGGTVLDPFMGSGSTGRGAFAEGFHFIGIDKDPQWIPIAEARIRAIAPLFAEVVCA